MNLPSFSIARLPRIEFGAGKISQVPELAASYGRKALLVIGSGSLKQSAYWPALTEGLDNAGLAWETVRVAGEPSPQLVDDAADLYREQAIDVVIGIGGGSVLDAGKAIAGLLGVKNSVMDFLEGVGPQLPYTGPAVPYIAVPTTAGTGSEATKNAVLSQQGEKGFKKSFRHEQLVPQYAVVDPDLLSTCPRELVAANGMDAFTQLLESYVSLKANAFTDALALSGLRCVKDALPAWYEGGSEAAEARSAMAYGALLSGITLAQVGLGSVHGLASPLGAFFPIPHGAVCGTLVGAATQINIDAMRGREPDNLSLKKYAEAAELLLGKSFKNNEDAWVALIELLDDWTERMKLPRLSHYGVTEKEFEKIVANCRGSSMKTNPIVLTDEEVSAILKIRT